MNNDVDLIGRLSEVVNTKPNESAVDFVINAFKELLLKKELKPGDKIPSETELAKIMSVSRGSIREAMKIMSAFGLVDIRRGDGTYIPSSGESVPIDSVLFSFILTQPTADEIYELRMLIEEDVMNMAIKKVTDADLVRLQESIDRMKKAAIEERDYHILASLDMEFHELLADVTKNRLVKKIYSLIMSFFAPSVQESHRNQGFHAGRAIRVHEDMLKALKLKDTNLAAEAVKASVDTWENLVLRRE